MNANCHISGTITEILIKKMQNILGQHDVINTPAASGENPHKPNMLDLVIVDISSLRSAFNLLQEH